MNTHYQEISHALNPVGATSAGYPPNMYHRQMSPIRRDEEEEEDESMVEDHLQHKEIEHHASGPSSPPPATTAAPHQTYAPPEATQPEVPVKRRPGRPRGSKTKKKTQPAEGSASAPAPTPAPAPAPLPEVNAQNQQYYEFQWRVLNLCAEFYGAAEELLKATPPLVLAQCYQMPPANPVDPMNMVREAKRICDSLLQNPQRLLTQPPPPMYPTLPMFYSQQSTGTPSVSAAPPAAVINNPQSFVVPMGSQPATYPQYTAPPSGSYTYPYSIPPFYPPTATPSAPVPPAPPSHSAASTGANQGGWSEEEVQKLKRLHEESKAQQFTEDQTWDWVIQQYGPTRTRHQILIKATSLGLKESSGKGPKRQRRNSDGEYQPAGHSETTAPPASAGPSNTMRSPTNQSTPSDSPAVQHQPPPTTQLQQAPPSQSQQQGPQRPLQPPPTSTPVSATSSRGMPWPMPTVASTTTSPIISTAATPDPQRTSISSSSYYRPRPPQSESPNTSAQVGAYSYNYRMNGARENGR
ncbi:hypothetical protein GGG16DRAFT_127915 [Schizophyllum commune]